MQTIQVGIRFPVEMKKWLEQQASLNRSSQNSEVVRAVRVMMKAAGEELGGNAPAAEKTEETPNQQEANHHDGR